MDHTLDLNSGPAVDNVDTEISDLFDLAEDTLMQCKAEINMANLNTAIYLLNRVLNTWIFGHPRLRESLTRLSTALLTRFSCTGHLADLLEVTNCFVFVVILERGVPWPIALEHQEQDLSDVSDDPDDVFRFASDALDDFHQSIDSAAIDTSIFLHEQALSMRASSSPEQWKSIFALAMALLLRFQSNSQIDDLQRSLSLMQQLRQTMPGRVQYLCAVLAARLGGLPTSTQFKDLVTLRNEAVATDKEAMEVHQSFHSQLSAARLDPDAVISELERVEGFMWWGHSNRGAVLVDLADAHHRRFDIHDNAVDLDRCITLLREAIALLDETNPTLVMALGNLAGSLVERSPSDSPDNDAAIELYRQVLRITATSHPNRAHYVRCFVATLETRFDARDMSTDLNDLIELRRETATFASELQEKHLEALANALGKRYRRNGSSSDLDDAIELFRRIITIVPVPDHDMLFNLGMWLLNRFDRWADMHDVNSVIQLAQNALKVYSDSWQFLSLQASALMSRFTTMQTRHMTGSHSDVLNAVRLYGQAVELQGASSSERGDALTNLASALQTQFLLTGVDADLDLSIKLHEEAVAACHSQDPDILNNMAGALRIRFMKQKNPADSDRALEAARKAVALLPDDQPAVVVEPLRNLAVLLIEQYHGPSDIHFLEEAVIALRKASNAAAPVTQRFDILWMWGLNAGRAEFDHESALEAYRGAIELLPQLAALNLNVQSRLELLSQTVGLPSSAANYALRVNNPTAAVEFLEASRSVFWSQVLRLRVSLDDLRRRAPILADQLSHIMKELEQGSHRDISPRDALLPISAENTSIESEARRYRALNVDWTETLERVRQVEGLKDFLRPHSLQTLRSAAIRGPVIVLNSNRDGGSAALVVTFSNPVEHVRLPGITLESVDSMVKFLLGQPTDLTELSEFLADPQYTNIRSASEARLGGRRAGRNMDHNETLRQILAKIWGAIVNPVFSALKLEKSDTPPRLWWCPVGRLAFLPIHAAGLYEKGGTDLTALLDPPAQSVGFKMTAIIQPESEDLRSLPATRHEWARIVDRVPEQWLTGLTQTTVPTALFHIRQSSIVHFACHGIQDEFNALDSGLVLNDGLLKISQLMRQPQDSLDHNSEPVRDCMSLAFLSACETARGDGELPDEAMHLAATLLYSGFRGVVGTMWTIDDRDGPKVADEFYKYLFRNCRVISESNAPVHPDLTDAAEALHMAIAKLRKENDNLPFMRWVPFVHYGL